MSKDLPLSGGKVDIKLSKDVICSGFVVVWEGCLLDVHPLTFLSRPCLMNSCGTGEGGTCHFWCFIISAVFIRIVAVAALDFSFA